MITDIRDIEDFCPYSAPLFEYVRTVADEFWSDNEGFSYVPELFAHRYRDNKISGLTNDVIKSFYLKRYENIDIQNTLKAFGIDKDKFWYLGVCIKDYVDGFANKGKKRNLTPREELTELVAKMDKMQPKACYLGDDVLYQFETQETATLTFQVEGEKGTTITNPHTISLINLAISKFLNDAPQESCIYLDGSPRDPVQDIPSSDTKRFYWFHKYLSFFLKDKVADKDICKKLSTAKNIVSANKWLLVSRMIYAVGISNKEKLNHVDFLKNYLKKRNDENMKTGTRNSFYEL